MTTRLWRLRDVLPRVGTWLRPGSTAERTGPRRTTRRNRRRAVASLEFAVAGPLFLMFTGAVLEYGMLLFTQAMLDTATMDAARQVRTGHIQMSGGTSATVLAKVCAGVGGLIPCAKLQANIQSGPSFAALPAVVQADSSGNMTPQGFSPGGPGDDVVMQIGYPRTYLFPFIGKLTSANNTGLLVSVAVFQNELYK